MEAWQIKQLPIGTFRGVPFHYESHENVGGRNFVGHEFPDKNFGAAEDLGKKTPDYRINAYVIGSAYFTLRDALRSALDEGDSGILFHPYLGLLEVQPGGYKLSETVKEGGMARFEMEFIDAPEPSSPFAIINGITDFFTKAARLTLAIQSSFTIAAAYSGLPAFAIQTSIDLISTLIEAVNDSISKVKTNAELTAKLRTKLAYLAAEVNDLLADPEVMAYTVNDIYTDMGGVLEEPPVITSIDVGDENDGVSVYKNLQTFGDTSAIDPSTLIKQQEKKNADALKQLINLLAIVKTCEELVGKTFKTLNEALESRRQAVDLIDLHLDSTNLDDQLYQDLSDFKGSFVSVLPNPLQKLSSSKVIELPESTSALVLSYELYGSSAQEQEIIDRNQIANPLFLPDQVEVIANVS